MNKTSVFKNININTSDAKEKGIIKTLQRYQTEKRQKDINIKICKKLSNYFKEEVNPSNVKRIKELKEILKERGQEIYIEYHHHPINQIQLYNYTNGLDISIHIKMIEEE